MAYPVTFRPGTDHHHAISEDSGQALLAQVEQLAEVSEEITRHQFPAALAVDLFSQAVPVPASGKAQRERRIKINQNWFLPLGWCSEKCCAPRDLAHATHAKSVAAQGRSVDYIQLRSRRATEIKTEWSVERSPRRDSDRPPHPFGGVVVYTLRGVGIGW